jgi:hypothetical protein
LLNFQIKGKLSAPFRIRAVPGTQQKLSAERKKPRPLKLGVMRTFAICYIF